MGFPEVNLDLNSEILPGPDAEHPYSGAEYYVDGPSPMMVCKKRNNKKMRVEDCLVSYREAGAFNCLDKKNGKKKNPCYPCAQGARMRKEFSEMDEEETE